MACLLVLLRYLTFNIHDRQVEFLLESKMADSSLANHLWFNDSSWSPQFYNVLRHSSNILQTSFSATQPHHHLPCLPHLDYFPPCLLIPPQSRITSEEKKKRLHIKILVLLTCTTVEKKIVKLKYFNNFRLEDEELY